MEISKFVLVLESVQTLIFNFNRTDMHNKRKVGFELTQFMSASLGNEILNTELTHLAHDMMLSRSNLKFRTVRLTSNAILGTL